MLKIRVIAMGRLTEAPFRAAAEEYAKRISRFYSLSVTELKPEPLPASPSKAEIAKALDREADRILEAVPPRAVLWAMCVEGRTLSSEDFSDRISRTADGGVGEICFVVGSSCGLSDRVKEKAALRLSVSPMTFPHELFRVMLLEQIYRAGEIGAGGKYHK
ncbi:MAG: 23S rRNA (pseudouridine(1915)-N(3))-methyltransferase RlmH [Ruminococcaceae bacterium]|jgi:23S rRNA (pseudouridine1915-N3)-methyltransferase|nr:23S rRNA (pseudouridine(1915)-N(3))-methyltransferase RlmH [Oscillospiraceae bacterium]